MKYSFFSIICISLALGMPVPVGAHPLDISDTSITLRSQSAIGTTWIHPVELDHILISSGGVDPSSLSIETYYAHLNIVTNYLQEHLTLRDDQNEICTYSNWSTEPDRAIDETFLRGFPVNYMLTCQYSLEHPEVEMTFLTEIPLQTNKLRLYRQADSDPYPRALTNTVLNRTKQSLTLTFDTSHHDTDGDGLSDNDEQLYHTDVQSADTDSDGYSDTEEVSSSWDPLSRELSPGQSRRESPEYHPKRISEASSQLANTTLLGSTWYEAALREIRTLLEPGDRSILLLCLLVGILGMIHALGPGHAKTLLALQILEQEIRLRHVFLLTGAFTLIHLLDIIIVTFLARYLLDYTSVARGLTYLTAFSPYLILWLGLILFVRVWRVRNTETPGNTGWHIGSMFIAGLLPCAFGWSIFLMLLAIGRWSLALPVLLSLGLGIWITLTIVGLSSYYLREWVYTLSSRWAPLSRYLSSMSIIVLGTSLIIL